jgi:hypothetical protein
MECEALSRMESFFTDVFPRARAVGKLAEVVRQGLKTSLACFIGMFYLACFIQPLPIRPF